MTPAPLQRARRIASRCPLAALGALLVLAGGVLTYTGATLSSSTAFADRATSTLQAPAMRAVVARRVTAQLIAARPDLMTARPLLETGVDAIVRSGAFQTIFRGGVYDLHRSLFEPQARTLTLSVADVGVLVTSALEKLAPNVAARVPPGVDATLARVSGGDLRGLADVVAALDDVHTAGVWLLVAGALALGLSVLVAADRLSGLARAGRALLAAGLVVAIAYTIARPIVLAQFADGDARTAAAAVWDAFLGDLRVYALVAAAVGAALAGGAAALRDAPPVPLLPVRARELLATPARGRAGVARGVILVALGAALIFAGPTVLRIALFVAGAALVIVGARQLMLVAAEVRLPGLPGGRGPRVVAAGALLVGLAVGIGLLIRTAPPPAYAGGPCNGYRALCDRPLDQVAFPATHNAMAASTAPGWLFASQEEDIPAQLDAGVRGFLIDTHYGFATPRGVATELTAETVARAKIVDAVGPNVLAAVKRRRARIGYRGGGRRAVYLCHAFCEVGATPVGRAFAELRDFLVQHPGEVVILSVEDGVSPADTVAAFRASGLLDLVYEGPSGPPWPTLAQLIAQNRRVVVFAENDPDHIAWYRPQFKLVEETPYRFRSVAELLGPASCRPNRGGTGKSLFLMNHWVETAPAPRPTNAARVNGYAELLARARRCESERRHLPNLVAVDFYGVGNLFAVVRTLNGVGR